MKLKPKAEDRDENKDKDKSSARRRPEEIRRALKCGGRDVQLESDRKQHKRTQAKELIISSLQPYPV